MTERIIHLRELFFAGAHKAYRVESLGLSVLNDDTRSLPFELRKALAFDRMLDKMPVFLHEGDLFVGGKTVYSLPSYITEEEKRTGNPNFETKGYNNLFDACFNLGQDERGFGLNNSSIPAYGKILHMGLPALIKQAQQGLNKAADAKSKNYYSSVITVNRAALNLMSRYKQLVDEQAACEIQPLHMAELRQMSANLEQLCSGAPQTYWQALQLMYFIQFLIWAEGGYLIPLGRLDQILYPYYLKDKNEGSLDDAFALELLEAFFLKLNYEVDRTHGDHLKINSDTGQTATIGGVDSKTGLDASNELTMMILDAKCDMCVSDPKVHLRVHRGTPEAIWKKAAYLSSLGMGFPTYDNDDAIIPAFMSHPEYALEDARDYAASGCWEMSVQGKSVNRNYGGPCCLRCLEWALNDGAYFLGLPNAETATGTIDGRFGLRTGPVEWFDTFDKLFNAFKVQMKHSIDMMTSYVNRAIVSPSPFYSSMMEECLQKGRDFDEGGVRYTETDLQLSSLTNCADALYTIKKLVFEEQKFTLREFVDILKSNWEGHELLRQRIMNELPKFGNNIDDVDSIAALIVDYFAQEVRKHRNAFGQTYRARLSGATSYVYGAYTLGASADGRKARDYYSDNFSPMMGADRNGPTAIILSCAGIDYSKCAGGAVLDLKFHPSALSTEEGRDKFIALIKTYCAVGGLQTQINVLDNRVLLDAKKHPENYRDLMVRIWGFSAYFVAIPEKFQDHIIARSTLSL